MAVCDHMKGCTNPNACNFNEDAVLNDGSCTFPMYCRNCYGYCLDTPECEPDTCDTCGGDNNCCYGTLDCTGTCDGAAVIDDCGVCSGGTSGHEANSDQDCLGTCYGIAVIDNCGVCSSPSGHIYDSDIDCAGVCFGDAVIDECGVCGGEDDSCDIHIGINGWTLRNQSIMPQFNNSQWIYSNWTDPGVTQLNAYLNCLNTPGTDCIHTSIASLEEQKMYALMSMTGAGWDVNNPDLNADVSFIVSVIRQVSILGVGESECVSIFYHPTIASNVDASTVAYTQIIELNWLDEAKLDLFQPVDINGTTYNLDNDTEFDAWYEINVHIYDWSLEGYDPTYLEDNVPANDINNPLVSEFTIHHQPYDECTHAPGDVTGNGVVDTDDVTLAFQLATDDSLCVPNDTDQRCCSIWNLDPAGIENYVDIFDAIMLSMIVLDAG